MLFGRKKKKKVVRGDGMIDVAKLQKRGRVLGPDREGPRLSTDKDGFAVVGGNSSSSSTSSSMASSSSFIDVQSTPVSSSTSFSTEKDGYSKREVDSKIQELDRLIYKLEQRVEVLERKAGVDPGVSSVSSSSSSDPSAGFTSMF